MAIGDIVGGGFSAVGTIKPGKQEKLFTQASYGAHFAEVAVNVVTGETRVRRMLGVFAAGRILNEMTARSQCLGGMSFGIGTALTEDLVHDPNTGKVVNRDLAEYHVPVNADVPKLEVVFLPERDIHANPIHAKGIGELGVCGAGAAIANAIYNATVFACATSRSHSTAPRRSAGRLNMIASVSMPKNNAVRSGVLANTMMVWTCHADREKTLFHCGDRYSAEMSAQAQPIVTLEWLQWARSSSAQLTDAPRHKCREARVSDLRALG